MQKTIQALIEAMESMLQDRPLSDITVSDLCDKAMIRRATFYKHFRDKYDFLEYCIQEKKARYEADHAPDGELPTLDYYCGILREMLHFLQDNHMLLESGEISKQSMGITDLFMRQMVGSMEKKINSLTAQGVVFVAPPEMIANFYAGALVGVIKWWHRSDSRLSEDELSQSIYAILKACSVQVFTEKGEEI